MSLRAYGACAPCKSRDNLSSAGVSSLATGSLVKAPSRYQRTYNRLVGLSDFLRNPFSFLVSRSSGEDRVAAYVIREHERGRPLTEILDDPYIKNRTTPQERERLLDRPEVVRALGHSTVEAAKQAS